MVDALFKWVTPNQLTVGRIAGIPVLMGLAWWNQPLVNLLAAAVFTLACLTDWWDGALARVRGQVSQLGKLLDPIADKMLIAALLVTLVAMDRAAVVPTIIILLREFAVSGLRQVAALEGVAIAAMAGAKWKTLLQMIATGVLLADPNPFGLPLNVIGDGILWVAMLWTLVTGYAYFQSYFSASRAGA